MKNADMPAMPVMDGDNEPANLSHSYYQNLQLATGLTKREMMAMHFMPVIISKAVGTYDIKWYAQGAIELADALLAELDSTAKWPAN